MPPDTLHSAQVSPRPHPTLPPGHLPSPPQASPPQGIPRALLPSLPVHSENQSKGLPTLSFLLHFQPEELCRHCPLQAWTQDSAQLPGPFSAPAPICSCPAHLPRPRAVLWPARTDKGSTVPHLGLPCPLVWLSAFPVCLGPWEGNQDSMLA